MDNITAMRADVEVRPDPGEQASGKAAFAGLIEYVPLILMALACLSLVCAVGFMSNQPVLAPVPVRASDQSPLSTLMKGFTEWQRLSLTFCLLVWVITMGCIGGIASLGMQAIKVPGVDSIVDISNRQLATLRVILGGLFAMVLTFPIESDCFFDLCHFVGTGSEFSKDAEGPFFRAFVLILPFMLGFSTSLVMMVINQLNAGVLAFFGQLGATSGTPARRHADTAALST